MAVSTIRDLANPLRAEPLQGQFLQYPGSGWRQRLLPAHFDGFQFHCESGSRDNGRRIVTHEFPKKDFPYSEDMGKRATEFSVRGYLIQFVTETASPLYQRNYTYARDNLKFRLETGQPGSLQLPLQDPMIVVCTRYRLTEEERLGGYCVFDMSFVELGVPPFNPTPSSYQNLVAQSETLRADTLAALAKKGLAPEAISQNVPR